MDLFGRKRIKLLQERCLTLLSKVAYLEVQVEGLKTFESTTKAILSDIPYETIHESAFEDKERLTKKGYKFCKNGDGSNDWEIWVKK